MIFLSLFKSFLDNTIETKKYKEESYEKNMSGFYSIIYGIFTK